MATRIKRTKQYLGNRIMVEDGYFNPIAPNMFQVVADKPNITDSVKVGAYNTRNHVKNIPSNIQVDNDEIVRFNPNGSIQVITDSLNLGGQSLADRVRQGYPFDLAFAAQERYKDINHLKDNGDSYKSGGIHIAPSKRGTFTAAAKQHGMGVQAFASKVLANKSDYSPAMVKKANFARNASRWHHALGGEESINLQSLINRINSTSNADFVKRLKDPNRKYIKKGNTIYTHLMSYATDDNGAIVYPEVQATNNGLKIFRGRKALDRAIEHGDTLHMSIPEAEAFTKQYKDYYPGFKLGGETEVKNDYLTIPLKGNPLYDITGETKYSDYVTKHGPDFSNIKTTNNRPYNQYNVETAYDYFKGKGLNDYQIAAFLANAIEESGVEPYALDKTGVYYGISQWDNSRYSVIRKSKKDKDYSIEDESKYLNNQLAYYYNSVINGNTTSDWNHGGKGSGYNTAADARQAFRNATSVDDAIKALVLGYVRPTGGINSYKNRAKVAEQIYKLISKR